MAKLDVKITDEADHDGDYRIDLIDGSDYDYAQPEALEKVELTDEDLTFLKIGRQPGEFKKGDVVRVVGDRIDNSVNMDGDIGVISALSKAAGFRVTVSGRRGTGNLHGAESLKLIAPAESRVDISARVDKDA